MIAINYLFTCRAVVPPQVAKVIIIRVPVFKLPLKPDQLRHAWLQALHREDIEDLRAVNVCVKHFREGDIEYTHKVPNGDGTYREIPRSHLKLKEGAVPAL